MSFILKRSIIGLSTLLFVCLCSAPAIGQITDRQKNNQLDALIGSAFARGQKDTKFITGYVLDSAFTGYRKALSGSQVEAGKLIGSSASITDKGATVNLGIRNFGSLYPMITIGGRGKDNFVNLFEKGQYGNTISAGLKANIFLPGSGFFSPEEANLLHNRLILHKQRKGTFEPAGGNTVTSAYDTRLSYIYNQIQALINGHNAYDSAETDITDLSITSRQRVEEYTVAADTLTKLGLLDEDFLDEENVERLALINALAAKWSSATTGEGPNSQRLRYYLADAEAMQMKANWNVLSFRWWTIAVNYNVTPYKILDISARDKNYTRTDNDNFWSAAVSYNWLRARPGGNQLRFFASPTVTFSGARVYKDEDKLTLERHKPFVIGTDTLVQKDLTTEVYRSVASPRLAAGFELPLIWFWNKRNFGIEIVPKVGINDPKDDNVGLKFGVFIPAGVKDGTPVLIEPIFRLQKLFAGGDTHFWKDHAVIGFNLSVSLPTGFGKIGK